MGERVIKSSLGLFTGVVRKPVEHDPKTCEHCNNGYRKDFLALDHYGEQSPEIELCDKEIAPCSRHACYYSY